MQYIIRYVLVQTYQTVIEANSLREARKRYDEGIYPTSKLVDSYQKSLEIRENDLPGPQEKSA